MVAKRKPKHRVEATDRDEVERMLRALGKSGFASWSGGKPKGSENPAKLTPGPSITELVREGRR